MDAFESSFVYDINKSKRKITWGWVFYNTQPQVKENDDILILANNAPLHMYKKITYYFITYVWKDNTYSI